MDEALRLDYLAAMGIAQYVPRTPLPGALPSPPVTLVTDTVDGIDQQPAVTQRGAAVSKILSDINLPPETTDRTHPPTIQSLPASTTAVAPPADSQAAAFRCQIAIWAVDDLLVLAEAPRLDNAQLALLRNILQAIGRHGQLAEVRQFAWPLPQRKDRTLAAARDHFQGMLDGGLLQQPGLRQILCLGNILASLIAADSADAAPPEQYRDWPVIRACALHEMLAEPARKADTWRALRILVRA